MKHYLGLDLAEVSDYSALVVLRRERELPELPKLKTIAWHELGDLRNESEPVQKAPARYFCNAAERFQAKPGELFYPKLVDYVVRVFQDPKFAGQTLVVDGTGVGRPVVDLFRKAKINCRLVPVTITGVTLAAAIGNVKIDKWGYWHVPKKELVGCVQVLLGSDRLRIAPGLPQASVLSHEVKNFSYKISNQTAHVSYESWRERDHDDIVLALALAAWYGQSCGKDLWVR